MYTFREQLCHKLNDHTTLVSSASAPAGELNPTPTIKIAQFVEILSTYLQQWSNIPSQKPFTHTYSKYAVNKVVCFVNLWCYWPTARPENIQIFHTQLPRSVEFNVADQS